MLGVFLYIINNNVKLITYLYSFDKLVRGGGKIKMYTSVKIWHNMYRRRIINGKE